MNKEDRRKAELLALGPIEKVAAAYLQSGYKNRQTSRLFGYLKPKPVGDKVPTKEGQTSQSVVDQEKPVDEKVPTKESQTSETVVDQDDSSKTSNDKKD